ncbi:MAG TPA: hydroxyacid dehydrogenase [Candidatus Wildermuthbacteria bacterium]|nr:hydroxyacid dehydrogenase [Candidatus Wildermuthbacteria bacterium]
MKIAFFKLEPQERKYIEQDKELKKLGCEFLFIKEAINKANFKKYADVEIISTFRTKVTADTLKYFPNLKFIATRSTGYDHIDFKAVKKLGITVSNVPSYGDETVAEYTFGLILVLARKIADAYDRLREKGQFSIKGLRGFELNKKTLGVIGTGRIGKNVVRIASGFEMKVLAYDLYPDATYAKKMGFEYVSLKKLLSCADIVTLHVPLTEKTKHLINEKALKLMKSSAYLVNTSRGGCVETKALVKALQNKVIAGAALDVLEEEGALQDELGFLLERNVKGEVLSTLLANHIFIDLPNVIVTPHNAFNTIEALQRILDGTIENIVAFMKKKPVNVVSK